MRRLTVLILMMGMAVLSGCSAKTTEEPVEIEFIQWWASEGGGEYLNGLVTDFERDNPDIKVKLTTLPFGDVRTQVVVTQANKMTPDVIAMNPPWGREFYDLGILAPLDEWMEKDTSFKKEEYFQASFTPIEGNTYLAPVNSLAFFLFYNKEMFEEANLEPPGNWEELRSCAKALTDPDKNRYGLTLTMSEQEASNGSILSLYPLLYAQDGRTYQDGKYTVDTPQMRLALQLLEQINQDGSILPGTVTKSEAQTIEEFSTGNIGMMISHNAQILTIVNRNPELEFGIVPIPSYDGMTQPKLRHHGWDVGMAAASEHKEEAWRFISYMISREQMQTMCNEMLKIPAMYNLEVDYLDQYPVVEDALTYMNQYEMVEELMTMPKSSACWVELTKAGSAVIQGTMTSDEAVDAVQESWNQILKQGE